MTPAFEQLLKQLKRLPGLGHRSAERIALHLLLESPEKLPPLLAAIERARQTVHRCPQCGHLCEETLCAVCADPHRHQELLCIVEQVPDLLAMERSGAYRGLYHVLHGKLSPLNGVGEAQLNLVGLANRLQSGGFREIILALSNDLEGEATCHFLKQRYLEPRGLATTRIGFGLPNGSGLLLADPATLKSALAGRREYR